MGGSRRRDPKPHFRVAIHPSCDPRHTSDLFRASMAGSHDMECSAVFRRTRQEFPRAAFPASQDTEEEGPSPKNGEGPSTRRHLRQVVFCTCNRNSALLLDSFILSRSSSMACCVSSACSTRRSFQTTWSSSLDMRISSLRVLEASTSTAGKIRLSDSDRLSLSSMLPVPLNSSKITSSARDPVSTSAVARMVSEPPPSMLRAAPKNFLGGYSAAESTPPDRIRPEAGVARL